MALFSGNMNGHNNIHNQLSKSLEKILEDAYLSGELKLSGRKLKEFPKAVKYDLCDTVSADLSRNRFTEVPDELTAYYFMEKLLLSENVLKHIPESVGALQSLTYLDLSSNQLTELPREVCQMPLQILLLHDNQLSALPKEVGRMTSLLELDASHNRLAQVPMTLGDCVSLKVLNLSNNQLGLLPLQVTYLRLEHLDISCNCIASLPLELRNMSSLVTLELEHNPLVSPPTTVCIRGRVHIFKYLETLANKDSHRRAGDDARRAKHPPYLAAGGPGPGGQGPGGQGPGGLGSGSATIDCLRHRPRPVVDSGYCTDGVDKRWSNDAEAAGSGRSTPSTLSPATPARAPPAPAPAAPVAPSAPATPATPGSPCATGSPDSGTGPRISPDGLNGDDKNKLNQQTYRQYKEALRQQRHQDIYRPREQPSPPASPHLSPAHAPAPPVPAAPSPAPAAPAASPAQHGTPRRNGLPDEPRRPVQKVVPSRNVNKVYSSLNGNGETELYIKPTSPTKAQGSLGLNGVGGGGGGGGGKERAAAKGASPKPPGAKLAWSKDVEADKLSFTMKREFDKQKEETELLQQLRTIIETRLKMQLPANLPAVLCDGVVLCHLANHVRPRAVAGVHVPSPAQPKLTMARCRRNVDNFLDACRRIGVDEETICSPEDILDLGEGERYIRPLARTVLALTHTHRSPRDADQSQAEPYHVSQSGLFAHTAVQSQHSRYSYHTQSEDRLISSFNCSDYNYTMDESEEYSLYETSATEAFSPVNGNNNHVNSNSYYLKNKVQFVSPILKGNGFLKGEAMELYDMDEVDSPEPIMQQGVERYDRDKLSLDIGNNLNSDVRPKVIMRDEDRLFYTCLCLGGFLVSVLALYLYPL